MVRFYTNRLSTGKEERSEIEASVSDETFLTAWEDYWYGVSQHNLSDALSLWMPVRSDSGKLLWCKLMGRYDSVSEAKALKSEWASILKQEWTGY